MARVRSKSHIASMATYTITEQANGGYQVDIVGTNGTCQTVPDFTSVAAAEAWIAADRALDAGGVTTRWGAA